MRLLDTDILIDHFHGVEAATEFVANTIVDDGEILISIVSIVEILAGMRRGEEDETEALFALFTVLPADEGIARIAGSYLISLRDRMLWIREMQSLLLRQWPITPNW